jgi:hypothetical protein
VLFAIVGNPNASSFDNNASTAINIDFTIIIAALGAAILTFGAGYKSNPPSRVLRRH